MTTVHRAVQTGTMPRHLADAALGSWTFAAFTKGSVDGLLEISNRVWVEGQSEPLTTQWRERIQKANDTLAQKGMRVLGVAFRPLDAIPPQEQSDVLERDLIFIGLFGMIDPPRMEVKQAVQVS